MRKILSFFFFILWWFVSLLFKVSLESLSIDKSLDTGYLTHVLNNKPWFCNIFRITSVDLSEMLMLYLPAFFDDTRKMMTGSNFIGSTFFYLAIRTRLCISQLVCAFRNIMFYYLKKNVYLFIQFVVIYFFRFHVVSNTSELMSLETPLNIFLNSLRHTWDFNFSTTYV